MNTMNIHINETLDSWGIKALRSALSAVPYVTRVEFNHAVPHKVMVDYEEHHNVPVRILQKLHQQGLHSDIQTC